MTIKAKCHCGKIEIAVDALPDYVGHCNCSICSRYEALWGYYQPKMVTIDTSDAGTSTYIWGDKEVEFHRCKNCGCITHYLTTDLCPDKVVAVNFKMVDFSIYKDVPVKEIDGASF